MAARPRYAPKLDPVAVARLRVGRVPIDWLSGGYCVQCGPVLLPGKRQDYGELPTCPWCLVRQAGERIPGVNFVRARLRECWPQLPEYFRVARPTSVRSPDFERSTVTTPVIPVTSATLTAASASQEDAQIDLEPPSDFLDRFEPFESFESFEPVVDPEMGSASRLDDDCVGHVEEIPHFPLDRVWIEKQIARFSDPRRRSDLRRRYGEVYQVRISLMPAIHFTGRRPASSVEGGGAFQAGGFSVGAQRRSEQVFTVP